jgi:hypothetical protein
MRAEIHSLVPNLRVSPLALPPHALRFDAAMAGNHCEGIVTGKRPLSDYLYDTEKETRAGRTLTAGRRGPKSGVHLRGLGGHTFEQDV